MAQQRDFWTATRIQRLERVLRQHQGDAAVERFLARLDDHPALEDKRALIVDELLPLLRFDGPLIQFWEGHERELRFVLRDLVQQLLHDERLVENVPTNVPDTPEEAAERERLTRLLGPEDATAEAVIEDRGPR